MTNLYLNSGMIQCMIFLMVELFCVTWLIHTHIYARFIFLCGYPANLLAVVVVGHGRHVVVLAVTRMIVSEGKNFH